MLITVFIAIEMLLVRVAYMSELPSPASIINKIQSTNKSAQSQSSGATAQATTTHQASSNESFNTTTTAFANESNITSSHSSTNLSLGQTSSIINANAALKTEAEINENKAFINSFEEMADLFKQKGEILLHSWLESDVSLIKFEQGRIEFSLSDEIPADFSGRISSHLKEWTGLNWVVIISKAKAMPTLSQQKLAKEVELKKQIEKEKNVSKILQLFPNSQVVDIEEC